MEPIKLPKRPLKKLIKFTVKKNKPLDVIIISPQWGVYAYIMEEPITDLQTVTVGSYITLEQKSGELVM